MTLAFLLRKIIIKACFLLLTTMNAYILAPNISDDHTHDNQNKKWQDANKNNDYNTHIYIYIILY